MNKIFLLISLTVLLAHKAVSQYPYAYTSTQLEPLPFCNASSPIQYPHTEADVVAIVQNAIHTNTTVKAFGARHSATDVICTNGVPVDMTNFTSMSFDNSSQTATIGAGATLYEATRYLKTQGVALMVSPQYGNITIGGAVGTGAHGSSLKHNASLSSQVVAVCLVDGTATVQCISDTPTLNAVRVHVGLCGIVLNVTFAVVPFYKFKGENYVTSDEIFFNGTAVTLMNTMDAMTFYWFPPVAQVVVATWTVVPANTSGSAYTYDHVPSTYETFKTATIPALELAQDLATDNCAIASTTGYAILEVVQDFTLTALTSQQVDFVPIYTTDGVTFQNPAYGDWDIMYAPPCTMAINPPGNVNALRCPWAVSTVYNITSIQIVDYEIAVPLANLTSFIQDVKNIIAATPTKFPFQGIVMRYSKNNTNYMHPAYGRDTMHFEFYEWLRLDTVNNASASQAGYQTIMQTMANKYLGRSHLGKSGLVYHNEAFMNLTLDPTAKSNFLSVVNQLDPNGVFRNNFFYRLNGTGTKLDTNPNIRHCANLDNCICAVNNDCAPPATCTQVPGYTYNVCVTPNANNGTSLDIGAIGSSGVVSWLNGVVADIPALVDLACLIGR